MKIAIRGGHNYGVQGASAIVNEVAKDREIYPEVINWLKLDGNDVLDVTPNSTSTSAEDLNYGVSKANDWGADYFASIHLNAGGGHGTEVLYASSKGMEYANRISASIASLGFTNRGSKPNTRGLYELKYTDMVANIIETFFCDSQSDVDLYNSVGVKAFAKKIAEGIVGHEINGVSEQPVVVQPTPQPQPQPKPQVDANVLSLQKVLNRLGFKGANGARLSEDGISGNNTNYATKSFQSMAGLSVDGVAGNQTWNAINAILAKPLCKVGSSGVAVRYIQYRVGAGVDGAFGNGTKSHVIGWQRNNGLGADGIVGNMSWNKLIG